ncbi:S-adenosyl-L-methionine-dependent methyltransferase [Thamnidium elegans]|uniref:Methyltransferase domain-containing protein n=1 Tax=Thamnidium elegans TaxID=101142 RepID=A0A8H7VV54_9FUNG|nr:hypothetical protein INT48_000770 [Thamnidium elegans]KAI8071866.1 S-adenosyl-L-methionine-dependent methyltransferase [Thamnidium elegans]
MGARLSTENRKRVTAKLNTIKKGSETNTINTTCTTPNSSNYRPTSLSSQSSESVNVLGRKYHNEQTSTYWFPNDDEEIDRLVGQHFALKTLFNGNIPDEILKNVSFEEGVKVLDLGCGPGTWIMDVATEYPNSEFIGVDMCDIFPNNIRPANVTFQTGNVLEQLSFEDNTFDLINLRLFILAFRTDEWDAVLKEVRRMLKPGGYLLSVEAGMLENGTDFVQWAGRIFKERMIERDQEPYIADEMKNLLKLANFEVVQCVKKDSYLGRSDHLNREFLWDIRSIFKSGQTFLAEHLDISIENYPAFLDQLVAECQKLPDVTTWSMVSTAGRKPLL